MIKRNTLGMIFPNMHDQTMPELSADRSMGSIPFLGRYRMIDFCLSSMTNAGIQEVAVITKSNYHSLMDHIGTGRPWDLSRKHQGLVMLPPYAFHGGIYHGRIEALYNAFHYLRDTKADYVVMSDCNWIHNVDMAEVVNTHVARGADVTVVCKRFSGEPGITENSISIGADEDGRVNSIELNRRTEGEAMLSLNIIVVSRQLLLTLVKDAVDKKLQVFERDILANKLSELDIQSYEYTGYADLIYSLQSYYDAQMKLIDREKMSKLFLRDRPVNTKVRDEAPVRYDYGSSVSNSLIADGCVIEGRVENCVLFRGVHVAEGSEVKNSVLMQDTEVGKACKLDCVITDKNVVINAGLAVKGVDGQPLYVPKGTAIK